MLLSLQTLIEDFELNLRGVLHLGAHIGEESKEYNNCHAEFVIWVEANPDLFTSLFDNIAQYSNQEAHCFLISEKDEIDTDFHITNNKASSSILKLKTHIFHHPYVKNVKTVVLKGKRIDSFIRENKIDINKLNFLTIDLQGAELMALKSMGVYLRNIEYIYTEVNLNHLYESCPLLSNMDLFLYKNGFIRMETALNRHGWGEAFYLKKRVPIFTFLKNYFSAIRLQTIQKSKDLRRQTSIKLKSIIYGND